MVIRRAFTLIELLIVLGITAILASMSIPKYTAAKDRALVTRIVAEMQGLRSSAFAVYSSHGQWPPDAAPGEVPASFVPVLGNHASFRRDGYTFDWDITDGPSGAGTAQFAAITVRANKVTLHESIRAQLRAPGRVLERAGGVTLLIDETGAVRSGGGGSGGSTGVPPGGGGGSPPGEGAGNGSGGDGWGGTESGGNGVAGTGAPPDAGRAAPPAAAVPPTGGGTDHGRNTPPGDACSTAASNPACRPSTPPPPRGRPGAADSAAKADSAKVDPAKNAPPTGPGGGRGRGGSGSVVP